ncbi:rRNA 2'-O-methyltransferase fibrillarin 1-like isoform X2 [Trifolium pratense]|uniref:rRNA 2'-O-methyltransferase fibrillarin 1-like isoform X2 n=1 Tax=Trifolium pratense TaxID=57577 RepID=UPI001E692165|nr:rRNA 2'-O-methyltransferase fibrillarin 1-like isoform X2 [Trifolium pratense]
MSSSPSSTEPSSPPLSSLPIENIASRYYLLTGKLYPGVPVLRPPPPPPTSSFNVPQRPSKPQPCKIIPHPLIPGVYVAGDHHDREDDVESLSLYTRNLVPGVQSHDEDVLFSVQDEDGSTMEYREWDPFKLRFAAAILSGAQDISIKPGSRVLVLNSRDDALSGMTISHISDIVGPQGMVYVVEEASRSLLTMASKRFNIVPIVYGPRGIFECCLFSQNRGKVFSLCPGKLQ